MSLIIRYPFFSSFVASLSPPDDRYRDARCQSVIAESVEVHSRSTARMVRVIYAKGHCPDRRCLHSERVANDEKEASREKGKPRWRIRRRRVARREPCRLFIVTHDGREEGQNARCCLHKRRNSWANVLWCVCYVRAWIRVNPTHGAT